MEGVEAAFIPTLALSSSPRRYQTHSARVNSQARLRHTVSVAPREGGMATRGYRAPGGGGRRRRVPARSLGPGRVGGGCGTIHHGPLPRAPPAAGGFFELEVGSLPFPRKLCHYSHKTLAGRPLPRKRSSHRHNQEMDDHGATGVAVGKFTGEPELGLPRQSAPLLSNLLLRTRGPYTGKYPPIYGYFLLGCKRAWVNTTHTAQSDEEGRHMARIAASPPLRRLVSRHASDLPVKRPARP